MIKIICICTLFVAGVVLSAPFDSLSTTTTTTTTEHPYAYIPKIINTTRLYRPSPINPDVISDPKPDDKITFIDPTKTDNIQHIVSKRNSDVKVIPSLYASERQHTIENVRAENVQNTEHSNDYSKENHSNDRSKENHSNDRSKENHSDDRSKENHSNDEHKSTNEQHSVENQKRTPYRRGNVHNTIPSTYAQPAILLRSNEKSDNVKNDREHTATHTEDIHHQHESHETSIKHKREVVPQNEKPIVGKQNLKPKDVQPQQLEQKPLSITDKLNNKRELPPSENDKTKQSQAAKVPITSGSSIIKIKSTATNTKRSPPIVDATKKSSSDITSDTPIITALKESNENKQPIRNINFNYNHEKTIAKRETSEKGNDDHDEGERKKLTYDDQDDIDDNKPPTLVYPVPVNQIIKHGSAAPVKHAHHNLDTTIDAADGNDADEKKKETNKPIGNNKSNAKTTAKVDLHKSANTGEA